LDASTFSLCHDDTSSCSTALASFLRTPARG
jgi:hypothetical protein